MTGGNNDNLKKIDKEKCVLSEKELMRIIGYQNGAFEINHYETAKLLSNIMYSFAYNPDSKTFRTVKEIISLYDSFMGV